MALSPEHEAQILRYYHAERWRIGTIAVQLGLHRDTVARVLAQAGLPRHGPVQRASAIDPYLPFLHETLAQFPRLTAARLYDMVRARGYPGRPDHFRHLIARHRPRPSAEAYLRLRTLPGEQAQVDWGHFGHLTIGRARRPLMAFVMVLSWSRQIYLRFFLDARMENFLRGHVGAFECWGAVPRIALYDNLKSAVLERCGNAIRFHPTLLALAGHYRFEPRPVAVDVAIDIPDRNKVAPLAVPGKGASQDEPRAKPEPAAAGLDAGEEVIGTSSRAEPAAQVEAKPEARTKPKPAPRPEPKAEPKPEPKVEHKPEPKPDAKPARPDDAARARALLEGRGQEPAQAAGAIAVEPERQHRAAKLLDRRPRAVGRQCDHVRRVGERGAQQREIGQAAHSGQ